MVERSLDWDVFVVRGELGESFACLQAEMVIIEVARKYKGASSGFLS